MNKNIAEEPLLRFPEFSEPWKTKPISSLLIRSKKPLQPIPNGEYREIGVRSHGRGVFLKDTVLGASLGDKRVFYVTPNSLVLNIVFAWEQAVALTTERELGFIASHRFPMFLERKGQSYLPFILEILLTKRGKWLLELASPGGAGRNKTLGQQDFLELKIQVPSRSEQKKIATFLGAVNEKLKGLQNKRDLLTNYKRGVMQQIFSQQIRFKRDDGGEFQDWEMKRLGGLGAFRGGGTPDTTIKKYWSGSIPWVSSSDIQEDVVNNVAPTRFISDEALNHSATSIVPENSLLIVSRVGVGKIAVNKNVVCTSQDFCNFTPTKVNVMFVAHWFLCHKNLLQELSQGTSIKGLTVSDLKAIEVPIPHRDEQRKIADFLSALDAKIDSVAEQITQIETFKKGLLQQMFV